MRAGRRNKLIEIQMPYETENEYGEKEIQWIEFCKEIWARVEPLRGKEFYAAQQVNNENILIITINYMADMSDKFRINYNDRVFEIKNIINVDERNVDLELMCSEIT